MEGSSVSTAIDVDEEAEYSVHKTFFPKNLFDVLHEELKDMVKPCSSRESCRIWLDEHRRFDHVPVSVVYVEEFLKEMFGVSFAYVLVHLYKDANAKIGWHYDSEAMTTPVYSVNIGGTRKFSFRDRKTKKVTDLMLEDGDLLIMKIGCQDRYEHCVRSIQSLGEPRYNLTFRF